MFALKNDFFMCQLRLAEVARLDDACEKVKTPIKSVIYLQAGYRSSC